jgi:excisionase family DNA binding protein
MDKLLTIKEVAKILRVSERSVNRYIEAGRLRASRIGQWRIKESDLEKFLKENSNVKNKATKKP